MLAMDKIRVVAIARIKLSNWLKKVEARERTHTYTHVYKSMNKNSFNSIEDSPKITTVAKGDSDNNGVGGGGWRQQQKCQ